MGFEQLLPFIQEVGFPIVVTLYLLHRIEVKLEKLNDSILQLPERMEGKSAISIVKKETV